MTLMTTQTNKAQSLSVTVASLAQRSDSFYVGGVVNGKLRSLLLDTGATMTNLL